MLVDGIDLLLVRGQLGGRPLEGHQDNVAPRLDAHRYGALGHRGRSHDMHGCYMIPVLGSVIVLSMTFVGCHFIHEHV